MVVAVATSLATIVITSMSAMYAHHRRGAVDWSVVGSLFPGILLGAAIGSAIADRMPVAVLKMIFACFLLCVALRMLASGHHDGMDYWPRGRWLYGLAGLAIGTISVMLGIGGRTLSVPFLVKCRFPMRNAVAISSACGLPIALAGVASYIVLGWRHREMPEYSLGYVYLPAFAGIVLTSVLFASLGASLAHHLHTAMLKRLFAGVLLGIGANMLWPLLATFGRPG